MIRPQRVKEILTGYGITEFAVIPTEKVIFLEGKSVSSDFKTCVMFLIPYNTGEKITDKYNMGRFARSLDYHAFARSTGEKAAEAIVNEYGGTYKIFCDSSPVNEKKTAVTAGLGFTGKNSLLLNETYGSYCFICEIFFTSKAESLIRESGSSVCAGCGACRNACPVGAITDVGFLKEKCLSFISQKKAKTDEEAALLKKHRTVWGCDICQQVCPVNKKAVLSNIEYFKRDFISELTPRTVSSMTDEEYSRRSFSYRKRAVTEKAIEDIIEKNK